MDLFSIMTSLLLFTLTLAQSGVRAIQLRSKPHDNEVPVVNAPAWATEAIVRMQDEFSEATS